MNVKVPSLAVHMNSVLLPISAAVLCGGIVIVGGSTEWEGEGHVLGTSTPVLVTVIMVTY